MSTPFIGQIATCAFAWAPRNYALCNGATVNISQNTALFSLIGVTFGGNGSTTFMLPNLQGRVVVGQGPGSTMGATGGAATVALTTANLPAHAHSIGASSAPGLADQPGPTVVPAAGGQYGVADTTLAPSGSVGSGAAISVRDPYLVLNYVIAVAGIFPSRT
jgi:microcystin-dependent protein